MFHERDRPHRLARLGATYADDFSARPLSAEIVIETDDAVDLGA